MNACATTSGERSGSPRRRGFAAAWIAAAVLLSAGPQVARAADLDALASAVVAADGDTPAPATAPTIAAVAPAEFAAGTSITISGQGFAEGDTVLLDSHALTDLKITATSITGTVPAAAKAGKKLILKRAKKKVGELAATSDGATRFTFVPAPRLTAAAPKFAAPGDVVTLKGKGLARVTELTLGGSKLKIDEQSDTAIKFTAVDGNSSGPLAVTSLGGAATLKKDYEVFYAPTLASVDPPAAFEGDTITLKGAHLAAASKSATVKFKLGSKPLKPSEQAETAAKATVPKGAKTGSLTASARGKQASLAAEFTVHPTPLLTSVPKEVGAPGELKVSGKHLDAVTTWRLGQVTLTPVAPASASKVTLTVPADAPIDQPLVAVTQGREFASKKPVATVKTPIVGGLAYWTGPAGKGVEGVIRGADFSEKTKFTLAGKPLKTSFVAPDRVGFTLAKAPTAGPQKLAAKAGKYAGAPVEVDSAGNGYRVPADQLAALLPGGPQNYDLVAAQLDLEASEHLVGEVGEVATQNPEPALVAEYGLRLAQDLQRVALAQAAVCAPMATGKDGAAVTKNAAPGELLRQSSKHGQTLVSALTKLWGTLGPDALAGAGLAEVDAAVAAVTLAHPKIQAACKGRFAGSGKLITDASTTVKLELEKTYPSAILAAFEDVLARGKNWSAVEKDVEGRLASLPTARKKLWMDTLKANKTGVAATASGVTGKGVKGDKHVDKAGKPTGKGGKAK